MDPNYERMMRQDLRRYYSTVGWILLVYYGIMNISVIFDQLVKMIFAVLHGIIHRNPGSILDALERASGSAWGYFLAAGIGLLILLLWKKPKFWREQIWARGKPMSFGNFFSLTCVLLSVQLLFQIFSLMLETLLNCFGFSILEGYARMSGDMNDLGMFLYSGILAPVAEEILFRGLIQRTLRPYGRRFAILGSAFAFGIFHGNILQTPYAFLCGLVLGYAAEEYSIGWAMLLHMINNLVIADLLTRLTGGLPEEIAGAIFMGVIVASMLLAIIILILRRKQIKDYFRGEPLNPVCVGCFFSSAGVISLSVVMAVSMIISFFGFLIRI